jgi:acetyl/propionyl-CoA carboxylase alpha subunit
MAVPNPAAVVPAPAAPSSAAAQMTESLEGLKQEGKLNSNREVAAAVRKVINENSIEHEIPAPMGAKVIAVHKHPGDLVSVGDKIVTLLVNGKQVPIIAKQDGIMQTINVSKGGVIGNSRPRAAQAGQEIPGSILITLSPLQS